MNSRCLMSDIGLPSAWRRQSAYLTPNLPQRGRQVLGEDLNLNRGGRCRAYPTHVKSTPAACCAAEFQSGDVRFVPKAG